MDDNEVSTPDDRWAIDIRTGELVSGAAKEDISYLEAIDIKSINNIESYSEVVSERTRGRRYRLFVSPLLLEIVVDRGIGIPALCVFCLLGQKIGYGNLVYTSTKDICNVSGYSRQTVSGVIQELISHNLLKEVGNKLKGRDDRFFLISPLYFFLGYYPHRDNLIKDWFGK